MLASAGTNEPVHKSGKSPTTLSSLQQCTPLKYKTNWLILEKKPQTEDKVSGCTHRSDLPYCMELAGSQTSICCSNCQALGKPVPLWGILKGKILRTSCPGSCQGLTPKFPNQGWLATSSKAPGWLRQNLLESKVMLLTTLQANKSRNELLGRGIVTLFRNPADQEDGSLTSQRTIFGARVKIQAPFILIGEGVESNTCGFHQPLRRCVNFFLPAVIHRWAWSGCSQ